MQSRLPLLLQSTQTCTKDIVEWLLPKTAHNKKALFLLLMLYTSLPFIGKYLKDARGETFNETVLSTMSTRSVDIISHTLLSALSATTRSKDWSRKSQDLETCARKLASAHPDLVLRQLPMVAGSLRGRAQYDWGVLKSRGHLMLFGQVLGLLELLQPKVFMQTEALCNILDSYFKLLQVHGHTKDLTVTINRLVPFLQNWMTRDIENALKYLHKHGALIKWVFYVFIYYLICFYIFVFFISFTVIGTLLSVHYSTINLNA